MTLFVPLDHLRVQHNYTGSTWQDFTGDLVGIRVNLREMPGLHTASLSFFNVAMDPSQSSGTRVIKKGDKVRISAHNGSSARRKMGTFIVKKVTVEIDPKAPVGKQNRVSVILHGYGVAGVAGTGASSGVGTPEELSNVITAAPFQIDADPNTYAWTGTAGASTSTETTPAGVVRTNLCTNGGFEYGTTGWTANAATITRVTDWSDDGAYGLNVVSSGTSTDSFASINLAATTGHTYTVSATIRLEGVLGGSTSAHARRISVFDATFANNYESTQVTNDEGETRVSVTFTAALTNTHLVRLYNGHQLAAATVYWDSVLIEEAASDLGYFDGDSYGYGGITTPTDGVLQRTNLCPNPSFETNTTTWSNNAATGVTISRVTSDHVVGTACLQSAQGGTGNTAVASCTAFTTVVGQTYTMSGYVKSATAGLSVQAKALTYSGTSATLTTGVWTRFSVTFVATATSTAARFTATAGSNSVFNILLDAVQIEAGTSATTYFDGTTTDTDSRLYAWSGTAHASTSTETATFTEVASIDNASELDQVLLTRESNPGVVVYEDPSGTMQVFDSATKRTAAAAHTWTDDEYASIDLQFDMSHIVNVLPLTYFEKIKKANGKGTRKVAHTVVYEDAPSIAKYGRFKPAKPPTIHKKADFSAYADKVFARNADPEEVPASITIPVRAASELLPGFEDGHYVGDKVTVVLPDGVTTYICRVTRIQHLITGGVWTVQVFLRDQDLIWNVGGWSSNALTTDVANNPDKLVLSSHLEDDIDATGKTISSGTWQSSTSLGSGGSGLAIQSDGTVSVYTGLSSETPGVINQTVYATGAPAIELQTGTTATYPDDAKLTLIAGSTGTAGAVVSMGSSGTVTLTGDGSILNTGVLRSDGSYADTTASAANAFWATDHHLARSTSLRRAKRDIQPMTDEEIQSVLDIEPTTFFDAGEVERNGGSTEGLRRIPGVIAEQVEEVAPLFATYDDDGLNGVAYDRLVVALIYHARDLTRRLDERG